MHLGRQLGGNPGGLSSIFERAEPRQLTIAYIRRLVGQTQRKNWWQLAELAGKATPGLTRPRGRDN